MKNREANRGRSQTVRRGDGLEAVTEETAGIWGSAERSADICKQSVWLYDFPKGTSAKQMRQIYPE